MAGARPTAAAHVMPQTGCPAEEAGSGSVSCLACDRLETFSVVCYLQRASKQSPRLWLHASQLFVRLCRRRWHVRGCSFVDGCGGLPEAAGNEDFGESCKDLVTCQVCCNPTQSLVEAASVGVQLCDVR